MARREWRRRGHAAGAVVLARFRRALRDRAVCVAEHRPEHNEPVREREPKPTDLQTDGVISTEQLRRWANVRLGDSLFALDLARVKRDLEFVPLVSFVSVERLLPTTLRIRVNDASTASDGWVIADHFVLLH